jgi:hypothetical protein
MVRNLYLHGYGLRGVSFTQELPSPAAICTLNRPIGPWGFHMPLNARSGLWLYGEHSRR